MRIAQCKLQIAALAGFAWVVQSSLQRAKHPDRGERRGSAEEREGSSWASGRSNSNPLFLSLLCSRCRDRLLSSAHLRVSFARLRVQGLLAARIRSLPPTQVPEDPSIADCKLQTSCLRSAICDLHSALSAARTLCGFAELAVRIVPVAGRRLPAGATALQSLAMACHPCDRRAGSVCRLTTDQGQREPGPHDSRQRTR